MTKVIGCFGHLNENEEKNKISKVLVKTLKVVE